jgi:hypothetical protein
MKMDITPFTISYLHGGIRQYVDIHPCCTEDNIVDYIVYKEGKLAFTITRNAADNEQWVVALKNADDTIDDEIAQLIGKEIDAKILADSR